MSERKVFICDDNEDITEMLRWVFSTVDSEIFVETNSLLAFDRIVELRPEVTIIDLNMPGVSGEELIKQIRNTSKIKKTFILCITADVNGREIALDAGANMVLPKPFDIDDITAIVENVLKIKSLKANTP